MVGIVPYAVLRKKLEHEKYIFQIIYFPQNIFVLHYNCY